VSGGVPARGCGLACSVCFRRFSPFVDGDLSDCPRSAFQLRPGVAALSFLSVAALSRLFSVFVFLPSIFLVRHTSRAHGGSVAALGVGWAFLRESTCLSQRLGICLAFGHVTGSLLQDRKTTGRPTKCADDYHSSLMLTLESNTLEHVCICITTEAPFVVGGGGWWWWWWRKNQNLHLVVCGKSDPMRIGPCLFAEWVGWWWDVNGA